jgi:flagellar M-ring protein FliF
MQRTWRQLQRFWAGRNGQQRRLLIAGGVATIAVLAVLAHLIATPDMKPLMTGMDPADAQALASTLTAKGIPNAISPDGKQVSVPVDKMAEARLDAAGADGPHSGRMGFEIFDKVSWGETEFDEKVNYQRALEGELERSIMTMSAVKSARVHLVMATDSVFLDQARSAKASVALKLREGSLSHEEIVAIQRLVAGAVDGLKSQDVAIIDADSNTALGVTGNDGNGDGELDKQLQQKLIATLTPVVGADHIRASVHVEYDPGTTEQSQERYDPSVSVPLTVSRSDEETGSGATASGVPGTTSNVPQAKGSLPNVPNVPDSGAEVAKTENSTFGVNRTVTHSLEPAGRLRRITAALLVDDATIHRQLPKGKVQDVMVKRSPEQLKQLQDLAAAAIGLDTTRGDVMTIEDMSFLQTQIPGPTAPSLLDRVQKGMNDYAMVIRYGALLTLFVLAYVLMLRPIQKRALGGPRVAEPPMAAFPVELPTVQLPPSDPGETALLSAALKERLVELVKAEPQNSTRAVQAWLHEEQA